MSIFALGTLLSSTSVAAEPIPLETSFLIEIAADPRMCRRPRCGGWLYKAVVGQTLCPDGSYADYCYAGALDFGGLGEFGTTNSPVDQLLDLAVEGTIHLEVVVDGESEPYGVLEVVGFQRAGKIPA